ncbi:copper chaperone PCu(A)C [Tessaracoccus caeni]|uniref:copper chaperone PCu(A)C n=1 Tax=Tessaracoccus caeni TaxID=3031239 RepID=UPI0023DB5308|nr:copper chaperone PCu(A)C [Tessaracoccus caeni]MDF1488264.1 copper chaperone PCu(A)C [Tessaracoccus caeni]
MKRVSVVLIAAVVGLSGCGGGASAEPPGVLAADAWVRTTDDAERPDMTALFVNFTNPGDSDVTLTGADCGDVAESAEIHEMVMEDGQMLMRKAENGVVVKAGSHEHLAPGGPHVMLMGLTRELPAGSEEVSCTLTFDNGQTIDVTAPVKQFTEEQDTYHTHEED